jgi:hypothetical protein
VDWFLGFFLPRRKRQTHRSGEVAADARRAHAETPGRSHIRWKEIFAVALMADALLLGVQSILSVVIDGEGLWRTSWVAGAVFMGADTAHWPAVFDFTAITAALAAIFPSSFAMAVCLALVLPRPTLEQSLLCEIGLGLLLYFVDVHVFTHWFPFLAQERNWWDILSHMIFGSGTAWLLTKISRKP